MPVKPIRLQLSRKKGARLVSPNGLPIKVVSRPSKFSNPYRLEEYIIEGEKDKAKIKRIQRELAVRDFEAALYMASPPNPIAGYLGFTYEDIKRELKGYNLACTCSLDPNDGPCHVDVLLRIANE
jgi:hypothetical protein